MSPIDLIILGFLYEKDMNAYDLVNYISERQVEKFLKISTPAVYKRCKSLSADGFLRGKTVREGAQPEKTIYSISEKGREKFYLLMNHFSSKFNPFFLDCNVFIWNLEKLEKKEGLRMLLNLQEQLQSLKKWIMQHEKESSGRISFSGGAIVKQYRMIISALIEWIGEVISDYKRIRNKG